MTVPRRHPLLPGSDGALLRRRPLRTGRARFPCIRLKQALWVAGAQSAAGLPFAGGPAVAVCVEQTELRTVRAAVLSQVDGVVVHRFAQAAVPLFPLVWGLWRAVGVQEELPAV